MSAQSLQSVAETCCGKCRIRFLVGKFIMKRPNMAFQIENAILRVISWDLLKIYPAKSFFIGKHVYREQTHKKVSSNPVQKVTEHFASKLSF